MFVRHGLNVINNAFERDIAVEHNYYYFHVFVSIFSFCFGYYLYRSFIFYIYFRFSWVFFVFFGDVVKSAFLPFLGTTNVRLKENVRRCLYLFKFNQL